MARSHTRPSALSGWRLTTIAFALAWVISVALILHRPGVIGLREAILFTARWASALFCLSFVASAVSKLWPSSWTRSLLANRRYLGVAFGLTMIFHLLLLAFYAKIATAAFLAATPFFAAVIGGTTSVLLILMTITSFERAKDRVSHASWKILHTVGAYAIWFTFVMAYFMHLNDHFGPIFEAGVLLLLVASLLLRVFAYVHTLAGQSDGRRKDVAHGEVG